MDRRIRSVEDVLTLLDGLFAREADRWTGDGADGGLIGVGSLVLLSGYASATGGGAVQS